MTSFDSELHAVSNQELPRPNTGCRREATCCILLIVAPTIGKQQSREEVETVLTSDLELALERFQAANSAFLEAAAAGSLETPRLEQAKARAASELRSALRRHSRFILDHQIPEDLVSQTSRAQAGASE